jgi:hypothetical protein
MRKASLMLLWGTAPFAGGALLSFLLPTGSLDRTWQALRGTPVLDLPPAIRIDECERNEIVTAPFSVGNSGRGNLVLSDFRTGCACNALERNGTEGPTQVGTIEVRPGERAELLLRMSIRAPVGSELSETIRFRTNDPNRPEAGLTVTIAKVKGGLLLSPARLDLGTIPPGGTAKGTVTVRDNSKVPRTVRQVGSSNPDLCTVRYEPAKVPVVEPASDGRTLGQVGVEVKGSSPGPLTAEIRIVTDDAGHGPDILHVFARVAAPIEAVPAALVLPRASGSGPVRHIDVRCRSTAGLPLRLTACDPLPRGLTAVISPSAGDPSQANVRVEWDPSIGVPREYRLQFRGRLGDKDETVEIPVRLLAPAGP